MLPPSITSGLGTRERRWLLAFLILGSAYFASLLLQQAVFVLGGFSSIFLILFLAWLMAFVMAPFVNALSEGLHMPRGLATTIVYLVAQNIRSARVLRTLVLLLVAACVVSAPSHDWL